MTKINEEGPRAAAAGRTPLAHAERRAWVRLIRSEQIGPATFAALLQRYGSASEALNALPRLARRAGRTRGIAIASETAIDEEFERVARIGARLVALPDPEYPTRLAELEAPPPVITVLGEIEILSRPAIAMVGARNASAIAMRFARELARDQGQAGLTVVSGLARGIDAAAHHGSLDTGTVAVLAGGVDNVYPPDNKELYARIREQGAIVSEMPIGFAPVAQHFPRRNRIISGLAQGVVVVEAAMNSGSLITARFAAEQGREVFAVPGSPLDPRCKGTNNLIRDGATLTCRMPSATAASTRRPRPRSSTAGHWTGCATCCWSA